MTCYPCMFLACDQLLQCCLNAFLCFALCSSPLSSATTACGSSRSRAYGQDNSRCRQPESFTNTFHTFARAIPQCGQHARACSTATGQAVFSNMTSMPAIATCVYTMQMFSAAMWLSYVGAGIVLQMVSSFLQMAGSMQQQGQVQPAGHRQVVLRQNRKKSDRAQTSVNWRHACSSHGITRRMLCLVKSSSSPSLISRCGGGVTNAHRAIRMSGRRV